MAQLRHLNIVANGGESGYTDVYYDAYGGYTDHSYIVHRKLRKAQYGWDASSVFETVAELEEHPDIWAAIATPWINRGSYATRVLFIDAIDSALTAAGYTAPGGGPV